MKLAIPFALNNEKYNEIAAEFNILFRESRNSKEKLIEFAEAYPNHRLNIEMDNIDVSFLNLLNKAHDKIFVRLSEISDMQYIQEFKEKNIRFFFNNATLPATSIVTLDYLLSLGVSDVYIADDLLYNLKETRDIVSSHGAKIRMVLNVMPTSIPLLDEVTGPWFPPDAADILDEYIDTAEFACGSPYNWHKHGVFYRAWFENKTWHGNLNEIITRLSIDIPDDSLFAQELIRYKIHCGKHCANLDRPCRRCQGYVELANALSEKKIGIRKN